MMYLLCSMIRLLSFSILGWPGGAKVWPDDVSSVQYDQVIIIFYTVPTVCSAQVNSWTRRLFLYELVLGLCRAPLSIMLVFSCKPRLYLIDSFLIMPDLKFQDRVSLLFCYITLDEKSI